MNFIFRAGMHNNALRWALALGFVAFIAAGSAWAAPGAHGPDGEHLDAPGAAARADGLLRLPDGSVQVPMASQRLMGLRTVLAQAAQVPQTTELPGRVVQDPNAGARVQSPLTGQIEAGPRGFALPGQRVRAGEVLAYVRHLPDPLAGASLQAQLAELRAAQTVAEQRWQRWWNVFRHRAIRDLFEDPPLTRRRLMQRT